MKTITSRSNPLVARFRAVARAQRSARTHILLEGARLIEDARAAGVPIEAVVFSAEALRQRDVALTRLASALVAGKERRDNIGQAEIVAVSESVLAAASPARSPSGAVAIGRHEPLALTCVFRDPPCAVAAVGVQDPGNVGAIIRAADAAGASGVAVTEASADPFGWKALRGAMGSTFRIPVIDAARLEPVIKSARHAGANVLAAVPRGGRSFYDIDFTRPMLLLIGSEGEGLELPLRTLADDTLSIPMRSSVDSLNTATATALILYEARRQRLAKHNDRSSTGLDDH